MATNLVTNPVDLTETTPTEPDARGTDVISAVQNHDRVRFWRRMNEHPDALTIDYYVRADGLASAYADATDPSVATGAMSLATLDTESSSIPANSVIGFSSQGGDFSGAGKFADRDEETNISQVYLFNTLIYTNIPDEDVVFDASGLSGGVGGTNAASCFLASSVQGAASSRVVAQSPGSISVDGDGSVALVQARGAAGAGSYGIKIEQLTCGGNYDAVSGVGDIYSTTGETAEMDVIGGTVTDNYDVNGGATGSDQVFTSHNTSKLRGRDVSVTNFTYLFTGVGGGQIDLTRITATGVQGTAALLNVDNSDVTLNQCDLSVGSVATAKFISSNAGTNGTLTVNGGTVTGNTVGSTNDTLSGTAGMLVTVNGGTWTFPGGGHRVTMGGSADLIFNDMVYALTGAGPTRRFQVSGNLNQLTWNRCVLDMRSMPTSNNGFIRVTSDITMHAGSGMYACEIWDNEHNGLYYGNVVQSGDTGFPFKQCTFLGVTSKPMALFQGADTTGVAEFENCHFSGCDAISDNGASTTSYCSFDSGSTKTDTTNANDIDVTTEGFTDKDGYDLHIDSATSELYQAGDDPATVGVATDRDGVAFDSPNASTGAYEG